MTKWNIKPYYGGKHLISNPFNILQAHKKLSCVEYHNIKILILLRIVTPPKIK